MKTAENRGLTQQHIMLSPLKNNLLKAIVGPHYNHVVSSKARKTDQ